MSACKPAIPLVLDPFEDLFDEAGLDPPPLIVAEGGRLPLVLLAPPLARIVRFVSARDSLAVGAGVGDLLFASFRPGLSEHTLGRPWLGSAGELLDSERLASRSSPLAMQILRVAIFTPLDPFGVTCAAASV